MKYLFLRINGVSLYCEVDIETKIEVGKNLSNEMFYC